MGGALTDYRPTLLEATEITDLFHGIFDARKIAVNIHPVGSFGRRMKSPGHNYSERLGDIDLLISGHLEQMTVAKSIVGNIFGRNETGTPKASGIIGQSQVDIMWASWEEFAGAYIFYILPRELQRAVRTIAASKSCILGPKGFRLRDVPNPVPFTNESIIWHTLGMTPPTVEEMIRAETYTTR
jgi:DNA polymerase/3'-5' exonuclease PolX